MFFGDPSGKQRHIESQESAYAKLRRVGIYVQVNTKENDWIARRDATKRLLPFLAAENARGYADGGLVGDADRVYAQRANAVPAGASA